MRLVIGVGVLHGHGGVDAVHGFAAQLVDQVGVGRAGAQEHRVVAELACCAYSANGFTDDGAQHNHLATAGLHFGHLRGEVGGATFVRGLLGEAHVDGFQTGLGALQHFHAEVVILVHGADLLDILFFHHGRHGTAHLVKVSGSVGVLQAVKRLVHFTRSGDGEEVDHVLLKLDGHGRQVLRGTNVTHHHENLVLVDQLLRGQRGFFRVVGRVFHNELDLAAVDAALLIELVHGEHHAQTGLFAKAGNWARQVLDRAERNFCGRYALGRNGRAGGLRQTCAQGQTGQQAGGCQREFHFCLLLVLAIAVNQQR